MDVLTIQWGWFGGYPTTVAPTPVPGGGGFGAFSDVFYTPFPPLEDDEGMVIALLGLLEDDY